MGLWSTFWVTWSFADIFILLQSHPHQLSSMGSMGRGDWNYCSIIYWQWKSLDVTDLLRSLSYYDKKASYYFRIPSMSASLSKRKLSSHQHPTHGASKMWFHFPYDSSGSIAALSEVNCIQEVVSYISPRKLVFLKQTLVTVVHP